MFSRFKLSGQEQVISIDRNELWMPVRGYLVVISWLSQTIPSSVIAYALFIYTYTIVLPVTKSCTIS